MLFYDHPIELNRMKYLFYKVVSQAQFLQRILFYHKTSLFVMSRVYEHEDRDENGAGDEDGVNKTIIR